MAKNLLMNLANPYPILTAFGLMKVEDWVHF